MKKIKWTLAIFLILIFGFIINVLLSTGFFRSIENKNDWNTVVTIPLIGAEDIMVSHTDSFAIISSTDRIEFPQVKDEVGELYHIDLRSGQYNPVSLTDHYQKQFAPHGISWHKKDSVYIIAAISHSLEDDCIEIFSYNGNNMRHQKSIYHEKIYSPNDIVMVDENQFFFTNDHGNKEGIGRLLEDYVGYAAGNVVFYNGKEFKIVANKIAYANGINFDKKRKLLFVSSPRDFAVHVYKVLSDWNLDFIESIDCGTGVDNIAFDLAGNLWIGCHPDLLKFASYAKNDSDYSPSEVIKINYKGKGDYTVSSVFVDDGKMISGTSVAAPFYDKLLIGTVKDKKMIIVQR